MKNFYFTKVAPYAKAWVAAVIPVTAGIGIDVLGDASIPKEGFLGILAIAAIQWLAVYAKRNTEVVDA